MKSPSRKLPPSVFKKKLIVFDLDGTLAETKSNITPGMAKALVALLTIKKVAVISGGKYELFRKQLVGKLKCPPAILSRLFLFPTTATAFYRFEKKGWKKVYGLELAKAERKAATEAFKEVLKEINYVQPAKTYGKIIEDRKTQVTFSALGQDVVVALGQKGVLLKKKWTRENTPLKLRIAKLVQKRLPKLEVRAAGYTSIDVTRKGIDKAYGLHQIERHLHVPIKDMLFIGDAIFPGGNDYAARRTGVKCIPIRTPSEAQALIKKIVAAGQ